MLRIVIFVLIAANLLFFGWSHWAHPEKPVLTAVATGGGGKSKAPPAPPPCATLGPFNDEIMAEQAEKQLSKAGWRSQRRATSEDVNDGWWVYVPNRDAAGQERTLRAIRGAGLRDAFSMVDSEDFSVSVGLFSDEQRAQDRAVRIQRLKLDAVVKERRKQLITVWFDLPGVARETLSDGRLADTGLPLEVLRIETCPQPAAVPATEAAPAEGTGDAATSGKTGMAVVIHARGIQGARV
jgi:hypothetical protein